MGTRPIGCSQDDIECCMKFLAHGFTDVYTSGRPQPGIPQMIVQRGRQCCRASSADKRGLGGSIVVG